MPGLVVDNNGFGDLFTASKSGASKFTILNSGNVRINNLNAADCDVKADTTGLLSCGTDSMSGTSKFIVKQNDETIGAAGLQNDDALSFAVGAGETWIFDFNLLVSNGNSNGPDWRSGILGASGWTCRVTLSILGSTGVEGKATGTDCDNAPSEINDTTVGADGGNDLHIKLQGTITTNSSGTVQLQWSPNSAANVTVRGGSYVIAQKVGGSDLAEVYFSNNDTLIPGTVVSMDPSLYAGVKKSETPYDNKLIGIVSTKPGLVIGGDDQKDEDAFPVWVALSGRVPVNVTTENGLINPGDLLTSSSTPGVAMKSTKPGFIIGQALTGYSGDGVGSIVVFVKNQWNGQVALESLLQGTPPVVTLNQEEINSASESSIFSLKNNQDQLSSITTNNDGLKLQGLEVEGLATVSADLRVKGNSLFEGILSVIDTFKTTDFIATGLSDFFGIVNFRDNVFFKGRPTFNSDTAGYAVIKKDMKYVDIQFSKEYEQIPVISANIAIDLPTKAPDQSDEEFVKLQIENEDQVLDGQSMFIVTRKSLKGFRIALDKPALRDITFSWIAVSVDKPVMIESKDQATPTQTPTVLPSVPITPHPSINDENENSI